MLFGCIQENAKIHQKSDSTHPKIALIYTLPSIFSKTNILSLLPENRLVD